AERPGRGRGAPVARGRAALAGHPFAGLTRAEARLLSARSMFLLNRKDQCKKWAILLVSALAAALVAVPAAVAAPAEFSAVRALVIAAKNAPVKLVAHKRRHRVHQPRATVRPYVTISLYERTINPAVLRLQGCSAAKRGAGGIMILDFGRPGWDGHTYGTMLFSGRFAGNPAITRAMRAY